MVSCKIFVGALEVINWVVGSETNYIKTGPVLKPFLKELKIDGCVKQFYFLMKFVTDFEYELRWSVRNRIFRSTIS